MTSALVSLATLMHPARTHLEGLPAHVTQVKCSYCQLTCCLDSTIVILTFCLVSACTIGFVGKGVGVGSCTGTPTTPRPTTPRPTLPGAGGSSEVPSHVPSLSNAPTRSPGPSITYYPSVRPSSSNEPSLTNVPSIAPSRSDAPTMTSGPSHVPTRKSK